MNISVAFSFSNRQTECIFIATTFAKELKTSFRITPVLGVRGVAKVQAAEACMAAHSMAGLLSHPVQLPALQGQRHLPRSSLTWRTQPSPTDSPGEPAHRPTDSPVSSPRTGTRRRPSPSHFSGGRLSVMFSPRVARHSDGLAVMAAAEVIDGSR